MQSRLHFEPSRITLGSAQLGIPYGIANTSGQPSEAEAFGILDRAVELGINTIDTARGYGTSENVIGKWMTSRSPRGIHVITKVPKIPEGSDAERSKFLRAQIAASQKSLGVEPLTLVLAHDGSDLLDPIIAGEFQSLVASGAIRGFGASVYDPATAGRLIDTVPIMALQAPASIADRRFELAGSLAAASRRGIAVFVRSIFLQGVLLMEPEHLPDHLKGFAPFLAALAEAARQSNQSIATLAITTLRDISAITSLVFGVDSANQLTSNVEAMTATPIPPAIRAELIQSASRIPPDILLPTNWKHLVHRA